MQTSTQDTVISPENDISRSVKLQNDYMSLALRWLFLGGLSEYAGGSYSLSRSVLPGWLAVLSYEDTSTEGEVTGSC
jgi:hypothetical protein